MPNGHFHIGDLSFSFEGTLKELAEVQSLMREFRRAEGRLKTASGSDRVVVVYDDELEGEQGTFDKMRLRAYDDTCNYTLDIGNTDNNPLGIYVGFDQNIEVWDREQEARYEITPEGDKVQGEAGDPASPASGSGSQEAASSQETGGAPLSQVARRLLGKLEDRPSDLSLADAREKDGDTLAEKLQGFSRYKGRDEAYRKRVFAVIGVKSFQGMTIGDARTAIPYLDDEVRLQAAEEHAASSGGGDLPF